MISVLYLTKNPFGLDILKDNLDRQTHRDFEVIIGDELGRTRKWATCIKPKPKKKGNAWNLNSAYNELVGLAKGELVIFLQDYTWIPDNAFEEMWDWYEIYGDEAAFCAGGYGSRSPSFKQYRAGCLKPTDLTNTENQQDGVEKVDFTGYEINFAMFPTKPLKEVGFDESMDKYYGGDNFILAVRAQMRGMKLFVDHSIKKIGFPDYYKKNKDWEIRHFNKSKRYINLLK